MKAIVVLLSVLASGAAFANCQDAALLDKPAVPDGSAATLEQMEQARDAMAEYVAAGEAFLDCAEPPAFQHNYVVQRIERAAEEFNAELERFKQTRQAVASN